MYIYLLFFNDFLTAYSLYTESNIFTPHLGQYASVKRFLYALMINRDRLIKKIINNILPQNTPKK